VAGSRSEQLLHAGEEQPRLRALDDAVVVGGRHRHHLADAEEGERARGHRAVFRRVVEGARGHDQALAGHEAGRAGAGADGAGIGQRHRGAHEVVGRDRALARAGDQLVEGLDELGEVHPPRVLDVGDEQRARAVLLLHVDGNAEADLVALDAVGLALQLRVGVVEARERVQGAHDGPGHEVREADLAGRGGVAVLVEDAAVLLQRAHGDAAHRGRGGDGEARLHVLDDAQGAAADGLGDVAGQDGGHGQGLHLVAREGGRRLLQPAATLVGLWLQPAATIVGLWLADERSRRGRSGGVRRHRSSRGPGRRSGFGLRFRLRDPEEAVEILTPARVHRLRVAAVLLQDVEGEHVVPPEILHQGVDEWIRLRLLHGRPV
jgi:hypothetical protein